MNVPNGGGIRISREEAIRILDAGLVPKGMTVMCYQYGDDSCEECKDLEECIHWAEITKEDLDQDDLQASFDMRKHFELWAN